MIQSIKNLKDGENAGDPISMIKSGLGLIIGLGADAAVSAALGGLMPAGKGWKHLLRMGGIFVLAMMAGEKAEEYTCRVFDETRSALNTAKQEMNSKSAEKAEG